MSLPTPTHNLNSDWIRINALQIPLRIGCESSEREHPQRVELSLAMAINSKAAASSGKLADTVSYLDVTSDIFALSRAQSWCLLEQYADACVQLIFKNFPAVMAVSLTVHKYVVPAASSVALEIFRTRGD